MLTLVRGEGVELACVVCVVREWSLCVGVCSEGVELVCVVRSEAGMCGEGVELVCGEGVELVCVGVW